ncbi:MAG: hypothetical protein EA362_09085 [Saprospirales bacterium]|nr:MAG: hypothetical protein EA362_09085 [Saprospirales bacterium]
MRWSLSICLLIAFFSFQPLKAAEENRPLVMASNTIIADIAHQLIGDEARVISLVPLGTDPHNFDPSPADLKLSTEADLILVNGMNLENWMVNLIKKTGSTAKIDTVTKGIQPIFTGKFYTQVDPHAWLDPILGKTYARNISASLSDLLPKHKETIQFNLKVYLDLLEEVHQYSLERLKEIPQKKRLLITSHDAFRYFGERYEISVKSVLASSPDAELTVKDMIQLTEIIKNSEVGAIFPESTINPKLVNQIAKDNNLIVGGQLYTDSLSEPEKDAGNYIQMLYHNVNRIAEALLGERQKAEYDLWKSDFSDTLMSLGILVFLAACFLWMWFNVKTQHGG